MKQEKKICLAIPFLYTGGGAEGSTRRLYREMKKQYSTTLLTLHESDVPEEVVSLGFSQSFFTKFFMLLQQAKAVAVYCQKENIDTLVCNLPRMNTIGVLSRIIYGNRSQLVLITRNANPGKKINYLFIAYLWKYADWNISVSKGGENMLRSQGLTNTKTIYNVFDFNLIDEKLAERMEERDKDLFESSRKTIINVGRLHKQKGQTHLIDAFAKYHKTNPQSQLLILGEGVLRTMLQKQIDALDLSDHVRLLGKRENVFPYLVKADLFVLSSLYEGLPTVLIEAAYSGASIVASDCVSGPREILTQDLDYTDLITYPHNTPLGQIISLPTDPTYAVQLGEAINKPQQQQGVFDRNLYEQERIMAQWEEIFYTEV